MEAEPSYWRAALFLPSNLVALSIAVLAAYLSGQWMAGVAVAVLELLYLTTLSRSQPFRRAVKAGRRKGRESGAESLSALFSELAPSQKAHHQGLKSLRDKILENYRKLPGGQLLVASSEPQLDELLNSFIRLVAALNSYRVYLNAPNRKGVEAELRSLETEVAKEENARIREVKQKRVEILAKRLQRFRQAEESREIISHQLAGIEDLLRLTHEQSIAIRDPDSVSRQLETLTIEAQATQESVREMEKFMNFTEEMGTVRQPAPLRVGTSP